MSNRTYSIIITNDATKEEVRRMYLAQTDDIELLFSPLAKDESLEFTGRVRRNTHLYGLISGIDVIELQDIRKIKNEKIGK